MTSDSTTIGRTATYVPELAQVLDAKKITTSEILLKLKKHDGTPLRHEPGQFVQVSLFGIGEIPVSVCSSPTRAESFDLCIRAAGNVSGKLQELSPGDFVGIRGPLGHGFPLSEMHHQNILVIAGGIGIAPLRSLIQYILDQPAEFGRMTLIYGARNPASILFPDEIFRLQQAPGIEVQVIVDQPDADWKGPTGTLLQPLREVVTYPDRSLVVASVGPPAMYRFVAVELIRKGINARQIFLSLERRFKCGIGKCGHCQLNDLYVCVDGPVFRYSQLMGRPDSIELWAPEKDRDRVER